MVVLFGFSGDDSLWITLFTIDVLITLFAISLKMIYICPVVREFRSVGEEGRRVAVGGPDKS